MSQRKMHYHPKGTTGRGTVCGRVLLDRKPNYTVHIKRVSCVACLKAYDKAIIIRIENSAPKHP